ncbi:MAG: hypothetical protein JW789_03595 [Candidatus Aenigmarchaeota archaeon]|nr:hypothetical protein [Candidatus Aenigmarchaeota archaeon]
MGKLVITDECLVPRRMTWISYSGPDPVGFLSNLRKNLRFIFDVSSTRCMEKKLLWDYTGDPIRFYNEWVVKKEFSRFTNMFVTLRALGYVSKGKKDGDFSLELYGEIKNSFGNVNWFTKYIWIFYNYMFYAKMRESYVHMCRDYINNFMNWCKEKYGMKTVTTAEASLEMLADEGMKERREETGEES